MGGQALALRGYNYSHMPMMFGIIMVSAALEVAVRHPQAQAALPTALNLGAGLLTLPVGLKFGMTWQLAAAALLLVALTAADDYLLSAGAEARGCAAGLKGNEASADPRGQAEDFGWTPAAGVTGHNKPCSVLFCWVRWRWLGSLLR